MFKKLLLVAAFFAVPMMLTSEKADAGGGISIGFGSPGYGYGHAHHGHSYGNYIGPRVGVHRAVPYRSSYHGYSRAYVPQRSYGGNYGGYGRSCPSYGYGGYGSSYGRSGLSLRIGF